MTHWLQFVLLVVLAGCVTPSVPIPPPQPELVYFTVDTAVGEATFRYGPDPSYQGATVYVFNRNAGEGIITTAEADGSVVTTQPWPAMLGDEVVITFETQAQLSSTCLILQDGQSNSGLECEQ